MQVSKLQMVKRLLLLVVALTGISAAFAENRLYIEDFTVETYGDFTVPIMLKNDGQVAASTFSLFLPKELGFVSAKFNSDVRIDGHILDYKTVHNEDTGETLVNFHIQSMQQKTLAVSDGPVIDLTLKATEGALDSREDVSVRMTRIVLTNGDGNAGNLAVDTEYTASATVGAPAPTFTMTSTESSFVINPSGEHTVTLSLDNEVEISGMVVMFTLPEGFTIKGEGFGDIQRMPRVSNTATVQLFNQANAYRIVFADLSTNKPVTGYSGELCSFVVVAPADFAAETATIDVTLPSVAPYITSTVIPSYVGTGCSIKIVNGKTAYDTALAEVQSLRDELATVLAEIETAAPDVKADFTGAEITAAINDLATAIDKAYADLTLTDNYNDVLAPAADLHTDIANLLTDAKAAQAAYEAQVAEDAAKAKADAEIAALEKALEDALAQIAEEAADVKDDFTGTEIAAAIATLEKAVETAYTELQLAARYDDIMAPAAQIKTDIEKLVADAKAAQAAYDAEQARKAANDAAYKADTDAIAALQKRLDDSKAELATLNPGYNSLNDANAIQLAITNARLDAKEAYEAVATEGEYVSPVDTEAIDAMIDGLYAKSAQAQVAELDEALEAALKQIAEECPNVKSLFPGTEIATAIDDLKAAAEAAAADGTLPANYAETVNTPTARIEADIEKLIADAKAAQEEYETNEELRQAANEAAHKADIEKLDRLQKSLDQTLEEIAAEYPGYDSADDKEAIQKQIDDARAAADAALEAVADEGSYENELDEAAIQDAIDAIEPRAALDKAQNEAAVLEKALEDALATIAAEAADVKDEFTGAEIAADIEDLKNAIEEAGNNGTLVDNYASVMEPAAAIADAIEALVADAKAAQADFEKEQARKDANDEAYRNDLEKLDDLQAALDRALKEIADEYPDYDPTTAKDEIQQAIDDARAAADAENENVADEGEYTSQIDPDTITDMIEEMINEAKNSGIEAIYAEDIDGVTAIYTLDGVRHQRAIKGQINVLVKNDGSKIKVYVK